MTSRSVYSKVVAGSSMPAASGPSGLRCVCVMTLPRRLRCHQALGDFVEGVGKLLGSGHVADPGDIVAHVLDGDASAEHGAFALDNCRAAHVACARGEDATRCITFLGAEVGDDGRDVLRL